MTYTADDIIVSEVEYDHREFVAFEDNHWTYIKKKALCFTTKDGKFTTGTPDSDDYSYWRDSRGFRLGTVGFDYVFGAEGSTGRAVKVLNHLLHKGH